MKKNISAKMTHKRHSCMKVATTKLWLCCQAFICGILPTNPERSTFFFDW